MKKTVFFLLLSFLLFSSVFSQPFPRGAILDNALYDSIPRKATQLSRGVTLPLSVSLKQYSPYVETQGDYGTCNAWATGYAARTIAESIILNRLDRTLTTNNAFSPVFVYKNISDDPECNQGTVITHALDLMVNPGIPRRSLVETTMDFRYVPLAEYRFSQKFPIAGYAPLYTYRRGEPGWDMARVFAVKRSLAEGKPVVIGMNTPDSFDYTVSPWLPTESPNVDWGGHAMCVIGYDDTKYGGAFEIQNSWGDWWGEDGYIWIPYSIFAQFVNHAYELIEDLYAYRDATLYSGFVDIQVDGSDFGMPVRFDPNGYYRTEYSYPSGTRFRFIMGNSHPAYVYAFTADSSTAKTNLIFPLPERNESPVLDYSENMVAWPGENDWMQMDDVTGVDYLVVLYSKQELDINAIMARYANTWGSFSDKVAQAVGPDFIHHSHINYDDSYIRFTGSMVNRNAVMGLLLAIYHH